jgi:hypothetical protein
VGEFISVMGLQRTQAAIGVSGRATGGSCRSLRVRCGNRGTGGGSANGAAVGGAPSRCRRTTR